MSRETVKTLDGINDIVRFEWHNLEYIILQHSGVEFWTATMNSAMMVRSLEDKTPKIRMLFDRYIRRTRVTISYHTKMKCELIKRLTKHGKLVRDDNDMVAIKLAVPFNESRMRCMS